MAHIRTQIIKYLEANGKTEAELHPLMKVMVQDDSDGNEDVEYFDLVEVPDSENVTENDLEHVSENTIKKNKVQSKITLFFNAK